MSQGGIDYILVVINPRKGIVNQQSVPPVNDNAGLSA